MVECKVDRQQVPLELHATCASVKGLAPGLQGQIADAKTGRYVPDGAVKIRSITGTRIVVDARVLDWTVPTALLRFQVPY